MSPGMELVTTSEIGIANISSKQTTLNLLLYQYLYGRKFIMITDHKPLMTILGSKKGIPSLAAARLQHWALILAAYDYNLEFKPTAEYSTVTPTLTRSDNKLLISCFNS